jgi:hypothetical protein
VTRSTTFSNDFSDRKRRPLHKVQWHILSLKKIHLHELLWDTVTVYVSGKLTIQREHSAATSLSVVQVSLLSHALTFHFSRVNMYSFLWWNGDLWNCLVQKSVTRAYVCLNIRRNDTEILVLNVKYHFHVERFLVLWPGVNFMPLYARQVRDQVSRTNNIY